MKNSIQPAFKIFVLIFTIVSVLPFANATTPHIWSQSTEYDFEKGTFRNISVHRKGELSLSSQIETIKGIDDTYVWSITMDEKKRIFIGTGDPATVYHVKDNSEAVEIFQSSELYVQSIIADKNGNIYAGTAPRGIIYKINNEGESSVFCSLPVPYIWDMEIDNNSNLLVATGNDGILFKISPDGCPDIVFDSPETNLLDIILDQNNNIYIATEPNGLIYKIESNGNAHVLYDAEEDEIHCLAIDSSATIYAGTASGTHAVMPKVSAEKLASETAVIPSPFKEGKAWDLNIPEELTITKTVYTQHEKNASQRLRAQQQTTGGPIKPNYIYKITEEGFAEKIFEIDQAFIFDMVFDAEDNLFVVTGNESYIYKIFSDTSFIRLADIDVCQLLCCLITDNDELYFGSGNEGKAYKLLPVYAKTGTFISNILDTSSLSSWGNISWSCVEPESTKITLATRTGNSEKPDVTWSDWSISDSSPCAKITNSSARFIQYKATLQTENVEISPSLKMVSLSYLPKNQAPNIIKFETEKNVSAPQQSSPTKNDVAVETKSQLSFLQKPHHEIAQKKILWEIEDPNNDTLQVTVSYKGIDENTWKILNKSNQNKGSCTWDTLRLPDGKYQIKLEASDYPDNPPETALNTETISQQPLTIDNSRPTIAEPITAEIKSDGRCIITGSAQDKCSEIVKVQYTIDGQEWLSAYPADGIFDSLQETFQITTEPLHQGDYTVVINVFDSEGNIGVKKVIFTVK
ncbi:MAG: hypothetical protein E3K37_04210 [Candidatus Kuenenia sp.]|nr:hypothetical protein [Candidatus Kuenenia hertensis]